MEKFSPLDFKKFQTIMGLKDEPGEFDTALLSKAKKYAFLFGKIPGIQMVAVGNSVAMNGAKESSDIDFFIVTEKKRMWYVRIFLTFWLSVFRQRKTSKYHAGRFCLSFFITDEDLSLEKIAIEKDIYLYFWILFLKPIVNNDETYEKFITANTTWCDFEKFENTLKENKKHITYSGKTWGTKNKFLDFKNYAYQTIFLSRTLKSYEKLGKPEGVIISDSMLKFHDKDRRSQIKALFLSS